MVGDSGGCVGRWEVKSSANVSLCGRFRTAIDRSRGAAVCRGLVDHLRLSLAL